jgi:hypothetical protein
MCWPSPDPRPFGVARLDPATYRRHPIHGEDRAWPETNCYTDLMVELAHALGFDPVAMLPFTLAIDFEGDQWTFFKPSNHELYELYGFDVQELALSRPLIEHTVEQVDAGRAVLVEVDSFYLPDTAGTAYQLAHAKTTIAVNRIDPDAGSMGYFHNAGYFEVAGDDFRNLMAPAATQPGPGTGQVPVPGVGQVLPPYCEFIKWRRGFLPPRNGTLVGRSLEFARRHVERMPATNPFPRFKARFERDLDKLVCKSLCFHDYSFANLRQFGACYELAATWLRWLAGHGISSVEEPAAALQSIAEGAKAFQFQLARAVARGKALDTVPLDTMAQQWDMAMEPLRKRLA